MALSPPLVHAGGDRLDLLGFSQPELSQPEPKLPALNNQLKGSAIVSEPLSRALPLSSSGSKRSFLLVLKLQPFGRKERAQGRKFFHDFRRDAITTSFCRSFLSWHFTALAVALSFGVPLHKGKRM
jgi:hypothetical protein